ncbi:inositol-tetrakisphosphate 1-kinase-like isoform X2 [Aphidius gifuensis]|uniref:inositol-tetrakisphosphate 1-kinase-like isoform X2 n=1 Tax=Aphidius gifuensis TaxID=684658 RepID=UPI001CDC731C|nr:inositol-tetrakisphosphate 1-kinase-like isoform X2 [Aphidius gifuensis]
MEKKIIGYWMTERKKQKINWNDFEVLCENEGFILKSVDLNKSLESQGPFNIFIHKLTDILAYAELEDQNTIISRVKNYIRKHPEMIVIDPLENVKLLSDRHESYLMLREGIKLKNIFVPNSVELSSTSVADNLHHLRQNGIRFPFICKPLLAHGSKDAHDMMVVFNEKGMSDCQPPCVAQNFVNHNAILYKLFIVGNNFHVIKRPSLKNFYQKDCELLSTIFFCSHDVSKSHSKSEWSVLSDDDKHLTIEPDLNVLQSIVSDITKIFNLILIGVDVVVENHTGKYAIIDVNAFPGYDGYPNFFPQLVDTVKLLLDKNNSRSYSNSILKKCISDDLDSGFESDEKKKKSMI